MNHIFVQLCSFVGRFYYCSLSDLNNLPLTTEFFYFYMKYYVFHEYYR